MMPDGAETVQDISLKLPNRDSRERGDVFGAKAP
jgi:hypothetical protein